MNIKPCPFCHSKKVFTVRFIAQHWKHAVRCENCGAEGPNILESKYGLDGAERAAIGDWNTRDGD